MTNAPEAVFRDALTRAIESAWDLAPTEIPLTYPPNAELGDLASPVCFELARTLKRSPREIAAAIADAFRAGDGIERVEVAGAGYLNAFLDRDVFLREKLSGATAPAAPDARKIIVEHTNINPNKAAHIGHLRNAVLGDTLVRFLRRIGRDVEVQNYIDDTGVQVADLVVGFQQIRGEGLAQILERYSEEALRERGQRFDYLAWDLYAEVTQWYADDDARLTHRAACLEAMERGDNETAEIAAHVSRRMVQHHLETMDRIGARYDVLPRESDILRLDFWKHAFERLKSSSAIHLTERGKNAGCWVMDLADAEAGAGEDQKVIVRSNGTVTYVGKDIAYQMWKFGLLGKDFHYDAFDWSPRRELYSLWSTCSDGRDENPRSFGGATRVYNVIDTRQSYLQRVVQQGLRSLGHDAQADRSIHYAYEMVALTPAAVAAMFPDHPLSEEDRGRAYLEMSGRKGLGVKADDLLDTLIERARSEIAKRNPELDASEIDEMARRIAVGAVRYYMLRYTRNRVVAFDLDAALAFEGETGPYLQYSVVRARNILGKVEQAFGPESVAAGELGRDVSLAALPPGTVAEHWNLVLQFLRVDAVVAQAVETLELSTVAKHAYTLAQAFNSFYHRYRVAQEENASIRRARTAIVRLYHDGMLELLELLGIEVPTRM
ncbi:MAG: arginine--tRNA ligase [Acidobacteria bacterium]|nr:arginine--tRNA ligase [Acidobacteriota bacterium]NIM60095.1 arginine--tRNA ligase [Acidobacteriota bacterium]NIO59453.1 arginine--tRNA ligase [Acidobacteriota bacterium]NIQ30484.1 arginine--tRNA ligase [Acidobacteriota bacterium]NIQ85423.1 arginine--tRNA ligase [Acidobacteriota bacterium]